MRIRTFSTAIGVGGVLALAAAIPAAQAKEVTTSHHSASTLSAQTMSRLAAQWGAQESVYRAAAARAQAAKVLAARGWYAEARYYDHG